MLITLKFYNYIEFLNKYYSAKQNQLRSSKPTHSMLTPLRYYAYSWLFLGICATFWMLSSSPTTAEAEGVGMEMAWMQHFRETNRRILASSKYISYEAIQIDNVPCSRGGAFYYNRAMTRRRR